MCSGASDALLCGCHNEQEIMTKLENKLLLSDFSYCWRGEGPTITGQLKCIIVYWNNVRLMRVQWGWHTVRLWKDYLQLILEFQVNFTVMYSNFEFCVRKYVCIQTKAAFIFLSSAAIGGDGCCCHSASACPSVRLSVPKDVTAVTIWRIQLSFWNLVGWCTVPWSKLLIKMTILGPFLRIPRNF